MPSTAAERPPLAWVYVMLVAAAAGLLSWGVEEVHIKVSDPVMHFKREKGMGFAESSAFLRGEILETTKRTAMLSYGALGGLLGLGLGLIGGRARGSWGRSAIAALIGLVVGAGVGAMHATVFVPRYYNAVALDRAAVEDDLSFPFLTHLGLWIGVGLGGGIGLAVALRSWKRGALAILGGVIGVAIGTSIYEFGGAIAFPMAETNLPISKEMGSRALAHLAIAISAAVGAWGVSSSVTGKRGKPSDDKVPIAEV